MKNIAEKYKKVGLSCLPCKLDKSPNVEGTWKREFAPSDFEGMQAIGIKCGKASDGLECLDIDNHSGTATENLTAYIEQIKELYEKHKFPVEKTQGGGYHILWRCEKIEGNLKLASVDKNGKPDAIFETRGEGGYFVAAPTEGYKVVKNDILVIPKITIEERSELISVARSFNKWTNIVKTEYEQTDKPGDYYNSQFEAVDEAKTILRTAGWKQKGNFGWIRPGKDEGLSATFGKVAENVFYVFSSSAHPFEMMKAYSPFQIKTLIEFNGDFSACAKELSKRYDLGKKQENNHTEVKKQPAIEANKLDELLNKSFIDLDVPFEKPPTILYINDSLPSDEFITQKRLFTLGNFSAIIGKAKSRKTFFLSMVSAAVAGNGLYNKFINNLPYNKRQVLYFDTEQGLYDSANVIKRIERLSSSKLEHFGGFNIREYTPLERCELIEYALNKFKQVGFVVIDGIADLAKAINDEEEATRVSGLLLKWSKLYNCHISTVIHQNKNDNFATGHLGSSVMKKAEIVISVSKDDKNKTISLVNCDFSRGIDFDSFTFQINEHGLPEINEFISETKQINLTFD